MFVNKYSLLRRIISLTVASLMILAFTPGIAVIADDSNEFTVVSPKTGDFVKNPVEVRGTVRIPTETDWHIRIDWGDDTQRSVINQEPAWSSTTEWSSSHNYKNPDDSPFNGERTIKVWFYQGEFNPETPPVSTLDVTVDNTSPTVSITNPEDNAVVYGNVEIIATAEDANGIKQVEFYIDGVSKSTDNDGGDGYSYRWDSTPFAVGEYEIKVIATDKAGNPSTAYTKTVTVKKHFEGTISTGTFPTDPNIPLNEKVELNIPSGALTGSPSLTLDIEPSSLMSDKPANDVALRAYTFGSLTFNSPIEVTFNYNNSEVNEGKLVVRKYDSAQKWVYQKPTKKSTDYDKITIETSSFSTYGLFEDKTAPAKPSNLAATAGDKKIDLAWSTNTESDLAGYKVYYGTSAGSYGTPIDVGNATSKSLTGLTNGTKYYLAVTAYDSVGNESEKSTIEATPSVPLTTPSAPTATVGNGAVNLSWSAVTGATGYKVFWGTSSGAYDNSKDVGNVTSYQLTGLTNGVTYYMAISAYNASGESSKSSQITAIPSGNYGLTITKTVDKANASPNDTLTYTITYKNTGNSGLTNVQLTDPIPNGTTYETNSANAGTYDAAANSISLTVASLAAGSEGALSFKVTLVPTAAGTIVNTASIKSTEITTAKTDSASTTIGVASPVAAAGGDAAATGTLGPAPTAAGAKATTAATAKKLPRTGMELLQYLLIAMLLLASGFGLQFVGRREEM